MRFGRPCLLDDHRDLDCQWTCRYMFNYQYNKLRRGTVESHNIMPGSSSNPRGKINKQALKNEKDSKDLEKPTGRTQSVQFLKNNKQKSLQCLIFTGAYQNASESHPGNLCSIRMGESPQWIVSKVQHLNLWTRLEIFFEDVERELEQYLDLFQFTASNDVPR